MFRAQQNHFDDAVAKATDENLTSENWEFILDVCDKVAAEESGAKDAVAALIKRLAHRNANVQLYTLELANALAQNCGPKIHRELASRSFTDALLRLASDRNTHQQVKSKILERMEEWTEMFANNPDFGIMEQAYMKLKTINPNLQPPSKPGKREITDVDRQQEEEELQMALALSIRDKPAPGGPGLQAESSSSATASAPQTSPPVQQQQQQQAQAQAQAQAPVPLPSGTSAATISRVRALYDFQPSETGELQFRKGDIIAVLESVYKDWWKGSLRGQNGIFPLNYVEKLPDPTVDELQREAQMEGEVFGQIKNVEKLLTLLSTRNAGPNAQDNEEITTLYHSTLAIRPKLIELIGKYSQKKDEFTQLNEKFIKARRDYEALLEASMAQPGQAPYARPGQPPYGYPAGFPQGPPPPQADPNRYFSPRPQDAQPLHPGASPYYGGEQTGYPPASQSPDPRNRTPSGGSPYQQPQQPPTDAYQPVHHRPQSTYDHPQELGTSVYDSPIDRPAAQQQIPYPPGGQVPPVMQRFQQQQQQAQAQQEYSPSAYSPEEPSSQPPYPTAPGAPTHQPPPVPTGAAAKPTTPYPSLTPGVPNGEGYQAYNPSSSNPNLFYR